MINSYYPFNSCTCIISKISKYVSRRKIRTFSSTDRLIKVWICGCSTCIPVYNKFYNCIIIIIRIIKCSIWPNTICNISYCNSCNPSDIAWFCTINIFCRYHTIFNYYTWIPIKIKICAENATDSWINILARNRTSKPAIDNLWTTLRVFPLSN